MNKFEWKYFYRGACSLIHIIISTSFFAYRWVNFVRENNQTGHLLGIGNIGMAITIYAVPFFFFGRFIGAYRIGIDRNRP